MKTRTTKILIFTIIVIVSGIFLFVYQKTYAADCGGVITCNCGDTVTTTYTLIADLTCTGDGLIVGDNDITIDGGGYTITGDGDTGDYGIYNNGFNNVTTTDFTNITNFQYGIYYVSNTNGLIDNNTVNSNTSYGIYLNGSSSNTLTGNTVNSNTSYGIYLNGSSSNTLTGNTVNSNTSYGIYLAISSNNTLNNNTVNSNTSYGIYLNSSSNNTLTGNTADSNTYGIFLNSSSDNTLTGNEMLSNKTNLYISNNFNNTINTTNLVENKPVYYLYNQDGTEETPLIYDGDIIGDIGMFWAIDSEYIEIKNATLSINNFYGVYLNNTTSSTIENINTSSNTQCGIYLSSSSNNTLNNNTVNSNTSYGIYLNSSSDNTLTGNTVNSNTYGIFLNSSSDNTLTNNIISKNRNDLYDNDTNTYSNNEFLHNITITMINFDEISDRTRSINDTINFGDINMLDANGDACSSCSYSITTSPTETVTVNKTDNTLTGNFNVSRNGIYSLIIKITDSNNNEAETQMRIFVGDTAEKTEKYYYRGILPTHSQPYGTGKDSMTLYLTSPTETEEWYCGAWVQNSPDELLDIPHTILKDIDIHTWYKTDTSGYLGLQRYLTYNSTLDKQESVNAIVKYAWINKTFSNLDWMMDYQWNWYWLSLKLKGSNPYQQTTVAQPSYADFTYLYSTTPDINSMDNENIIILSATSPTSDDTISLVLENPEASATSTELLIGTDNPFLNIISTINSTGTTTINSGNISANSNITLNSVNMDIIPSSDSVDITINTWNTSGTYAKQWTETSSESSITTSHTIGNLEVGTYYTAWYTKEGEDQARLTTLQADANGKIDFTYDQGYSTVTFDIIEDTASPTAFTLSNPTNNSSTLESNPTLSWNASTDSESGIAKYQLYLDNILDTNNISSSNTSVSVNTTLNCSYHTWYIRAYDNNNNYTDSNIYGITKSCNEGAIIPPLSSGTGSGDISIPINQINEVGNINNQGKNLLMYIESQANFSTSISSNNTIQNHSFKITNLDLLNNIVTITIESEPIILTLNLDETKYVDLDNDGINDLEIKFENLVVNRVEITLKSLTDNFVNNNIYLFKYPDSPKVYFLDNGIKKWIINEYTFNSKGYKWGDIQTIDESITYSDGENIELTLIIYTLFKYPNSPKVYFLENEKKRWIINEAVFINRGYDWDDIEIIDDKIIYPDDEDINEQVLGIKIENNNYIFKLFLNIDSIGEEVRQLQTKLKELGYFTYQYITGHFGPITKQAVKNFQKAHNIEQAGYVGPKTREALNKI